MSSSRGRRGVAGAVGLGFGGELGHWAGGLVRGSNAIGGAGTGDVGGGGGTVAGGGTGVGEGGGGVGGGGSAIGRVGGAAGGGGVSIRCDRSCSASGLLPLRVVSSRSNCSTRSVRASIARLSSSSDMRQPPLTSRIDWQSHASVRSGSLALAPIGSPSAKRCIRSRCFSKFARG